MGTRTTVIAGQVRLWLLFTGLCLVLGGCLRYWAAKATVKGTIWVAKTTYRVSAGATRAVYRIGKFTYEVVRAPPEWPLTQEIETIDGLPPKEAIRLGRIETAPYSVNGKIYQPMSVEEAKDYEDAGPASWYDYETLGGKQTYMTANGEAFDPDGLTAAHRRLPLSSYAKVTNLENGDSVIVRVNDRGPFQRKNNPGTRSEVIELSRGAARKLGFDYKEKAWVKIKALRVQEE